MPLGEVVVDWVCNGPKPAERLMGKKKKQLKRGENDENQPPEEASDQQSKRRLSACSWKLWHEPDQNNFGPQIIVTDPDGESHYLIDPETHARRLGLYMKGLGTTEEEEFAFTYGGFTDMVDDVAEEEESDSTYQDSLVNDWIRMEGEWRFSNMAKAQGEYDIHCNVSQPISPKYSTQKDKALWRTRLRGGLMKTWKRIPGPLLPLHNTHEKRASDAGYGLFEDPWSLSVILERLRDMGILRTIESYCCP